MADAGNERVSTLPQTQIPCGGSRTPLTLCSHKFISVTRRSGSENTEFRLLSLLRPREGLFDFGLVQHFLHLSIPWIANTITYPFDERKPTPSSEFPIL